MITRALSQRPGSGEVVAAVGGAILLISVLVPIEWFEEISTGGLTGRGTGEPPRSVSAEGAFGPWLLAVALSAVVPLAELGLRRRSLTLNPTVRGALIGIGLPVLLTGVVLELTYSSPPCCDRVYTVPSAAVGLIPGVAGAALLGIGTAATWRRDGALVAHAATNAPPAPD